MKCLLCGKYSSKVGDCRLTQGHTAIGARVRVCSSCLTLEPNFLSRMFEGTMIFSRVYPFSTRPSGWCLEGWAQGTSSESVLSLQFSLSLGSPATSLSSTTGSCTTNASTGAGPAPGPGKITQTWLEQGPGQMDSAHPSTQEHCLERGRWEPYLSLQVCYYPQLRAGPTMGILLGAQESAR